MKHAQVYKNKTIDSARKLVLVAVTVLLGAMLHAVPAWAVHFSSLDELDVDCGHGLHLKQATGVPNAAVHTYAFGGACNLRVVTSDGPENVAAPPLVASAHWDRTSNTYTESLHLLASASIDILDPDGHKAHVGTYPEVATFKCDVDPVIHRGAHCSLESQYNDTGWHSPINSHFYENRGDQADGFAWKANHNRPLLLGIASKSQAAALSHKNKHPQISCTGLKLVSVHVLTKSNTRRYHFDGTCELYHTTDGSGGLRLTHVFVTGFWNANGQEAQETFDVAAPGNEGGGLYRMANYTCAANPFIHGNVQCSLEKPLNKVSPVYDPITDLRAKHPIAAGRANPGQVAQFLKGKAHSKKGAVKLSAMGASHKGSVSASRKVQLPSSKPSIHRHQFGAKVMNRTTPKTKLPAVQQHATSHKNVRFGGKRTNKPVLHQQAPAMHTLSEHVNSNKHSQRYARAGNHTARKQMRVAPHLKLLQKRETIERSCANLDRFITIRQTLYNTGGPLAAGQAQVFVQERGGAHIQSQHIRVPAMAHGAKVVLTLKAGTREAYRGKIPGRHVLPVTVTVNGKTTTSRLIYTFRPGICQRRHSAVPNRSDMRNKIKLNPQPEPPSAQHRFEIQRK